MKIFRNSFLILALIIFLFGACKADFQKNLKNGDIIFHTSQSSQSKTIQLATNSKYSHLGIIYLSHGEFYVF